MKYRYKVVNQRDEGSAVINPSSDFYLKYPDNTIVEAKKSTMGIFCYKTLKDTKDFVGCDSGPLKIKRILPLSKGKVPKTISYFTNDCALKRYYDETLHSAGKFPLKGTICYQKIKIINTVRTKRNKK